MGLADKLADIIRPRPAGLFSGLAPASTTTLGMSAASILSGAASEIAREGVRAFIRALAVTTDPAVTSLPADDTPPAPALTQSPVKVTWGGVPLRGFADDEYFSIDPAVVRESMSTICEWRDEQLPTPEQACADREMHDVIRKVFHEKLSAEVAKGIREAAAPIVY